MCGLQVCQDGTTLGESTPHVVGWNILNTSPLNFTVNYGGGHCNDGTDCKSAIIIFTACMRCDLAVLYLCVITRRVSVFLFSEVADKGKATASFIKFDTSAYVSTLKQPLMLSFYLHLSV